MRLLIVFLFAFFSFCDGIAQINRDTLLSRITEKVTDMPEGFAISIAVLHGKDVQYLGLIKEDNDLVQIDLKDSLFEIGSLTKVFTSTLLAHEVVNGNIQLTDYVNKEFSYKFNKKHKINYQSLSNHTSGLYRLPANIMPLIFKNQTNPYSEYSYEMFDEYLKEELQLEDKDSINYAYSNLGAGLLAYSLSKKKNLKFEKLLETTVFEKYSMHSTSYDNKTSFVGISANDIQTENWQFNALLGAGGLISNTHDLTRFISAQFIAENKELSLTRKETFSIYENMSIGLGWHILKPHSIDEKFWHNGGTGGFTSSISFRTSNQTGIIVLSNISALHGKSQLIDELCFELLDLLK